ncbi:MAG: hypothetical protein KF857_00705 [Fimbriimonadaceae bacterium]|nr:hypothetical protein [Fimbriimonadaceae bacterium]
MTGWVVVTVVILSVAGLVAWRLLQGKRLPNYLALTEYWVYSTAEHLPDQTALMDRMISSNPHNRRGYACIGAREGMLFTDVRLHMGLAKRAKNPTTFRPDLFDQVVTPTKEVLEGLAECTSLIRLRYVSRAKLPDTRQLQFMPHLTDAMAEMTGAKVVFDQVMERLWTAEEFRAAVAQKPNCERPDFHVQVIWQVAPEGCVTETRGLVKVGWPELVGGPFESDQEVLMRGLMNRLAFQIVRTPGAEGPFQFEEFDDKFVAEIGPWQDGKRRVVWSRVQVQG